MCMHCLGKGVASAFAAGLFGLLFFSAFWSQQAYFSLSADWNATLKVFAKYAAAFFFLGLAKMLWWEGKQIHEAHMKKGKR